MTDEDRTVREAVANGINVEVSGPWAALSPEEVAVARRLVRRRGGRHLEIESALGRTSPVGDEMHGLLGHRSSGRLTGVALVDEAAYLCCDDVGAAEQFAAVLTQRAPECAEILCSSDVGDELLAAWTRGGAAPASRVDVECLAMASGMLVPRRSTWPAAPLRLATIDDLDVAQAILRASVLEELGFDLAQTNPVALRFAAESQIEGARDHVIMDGGAPVFWASCAASTAEAALIEGVFVPRAARGRGWGASGTHSLCRHLLEGRERVLVRARSGDLRAQTIYQGLGFERVGEMCLIRRKTGRNGATP